MLRSLTDHVREALGPKGYRVRYPEEIIRELSHKISQIVKMDERVAMKIKRKRSFWELLKSGYLVALTLHWFLLDFYSRHPVEHKDKN